MRFPCSSCTYMQTGADSAGQTTRATRPTWEPHGRAAALSEVALRLPRSFRAPKGASVTVPVVRCRSGTICWQAHPSTAGASATCDCHQFRQGESGCILPVSRPRWARTATTAKRCCGSQFRRLHLPGTMLSSVAMRVSRCRLRDCSPANIPRWPSARTARSQNMARGASS
jgi:hypothetical protein